MVFQRDELPGRSGSTFPCLDTGTKAGGAPATPWAWHGAKGAGGHPGNLSLGMRPLESVSDAAGLASRIKEKLASLILSGKQMLNAVFFPDFWAKFSFCECLGKS